MTRRLLLAGVTATAASASSVALVATAVWLVVTAAGRPGIAALSGAIVAVRALAVSAGLLRYVERLTGHDAVLARLTERRAAVVAGLAVHSGMIPRGRWVHRLVSDVDAEGDLVVRGALPAVAVAVTGAAAVALAASVAPGAALSLAAGLSVITALTAAAVRRAGADARRSDPDREALSATVLEIVRAGPDLAVFGGLDRAGRAAADRADRISAAARAAAVAQAVLRGLAGLVVAAAVTVTVAGAAHLDPARAAVLPVVASAVLAEAFVLLVAAPKLATARAARRRLAEALDPAAPTGDGSGAATRETRSVSERVRDAAPLGAPVDPWRGRSVSERLSDGTQPDLVSSETVEGRSVSERVPDATSSGATDPSRGRSDSERTAEATRPDPVAAVDGRSSFQRVPDATRLGPVATEEGRSGVERSPDGSRPSAVAAETVEGRSSFERVPDTTRPESQPEPEPESAEGRSDSERTPAPHRPEPSTRRPLPGVSSPEADPCGRPTTPHLHLCDPLLDLDLPPGARVLLTGPSGSGKSTLLARLWGILEPLGTYTVDAAALEPDQITNVVGGLWQDAYVPRSTLRDALRIARPDAPDVRLETALATAGLAPDVLPDGLDGVLAENAENLSGGQRRRLLVARTLVADHPVMLFDEPVEGLPPADADRLLTVLLTLDPPGRTVVVVSHRVPDLLPPGVVHRAL